MIRFFQGFGLIYTKFAKVFFNFLVSRLIVFIFYFDECGYGGKLKLRKNSQF